MRQIIFIIVLFGLTSFVVDAQDLSFLRKKHTGEEYFNYVIHTSKTDSITSKELFGKITFINFWFETCHPCMAEMDALIELYNEFKDSLKFQMITFSTDNDSIIKANIVKYKIPFRVYNLNWADCQALNFGVGFPCSILLDEKKIVINNTNGGSTDKIIARKELRSEFVELITEHLKRK